MSCNSRQCVAATVDVSTFNLTSVSVPGFNVSVLGVHAFDLTCDKLQLSGFRGQWVQNETYVSTAQGGSILCRANLTAFAYSGDVLAHVEIYPTDVRLQRTNTDADSCNTTETVVKSCLVNASVTRLYSDPPSRLIDMLLDEVRSGMNNNTNEYACKVLVPRMQAGIVNSSRPALPPRGGSRDDLVPVSASPLLQALRNVLDQLRIGPLSISASFDHDPIQRLSISVSDLSSFGLHSNISLVPAAASVTAMQWAKGLVDDYLAGNLPNPFPVYGLPEGLIDAALDFQGSDCEIHVDVDVPLWQAEANYIDVLLDPGISIANLAVECGNSLDSFGNLLTHELLPMMEDAANEKIASLLAASAAASSRSDSDGGNGTVRLSFGNDAVVHDEPHCQPLICIAVVGLVAGLLLVRRNLRRHAKSPVLCLRTGTAVSVARLVAEDVLMIGGVVGCTMLFAACNTMTGATVTMGGEMDTYAFSLYNTVDDMWHAGLKPLSVCVLLFSGIYPYVKLLSLLVFTVWANRPGSRVLMLIDCIGKFSLIDTFALMVMASGLEIHGVATVSIHPSFFMFMGATIASIALGNYATQLWRAETTVRVEDDSVSSSGNYEPAATSDASAAGLDVYASTRSPPPPSAPTGLSAAAESDAPWWRWALLPLIHPSFLLMLVCSLLPWFLPCLRYTVGGIARLLAPEPKSRTLYTLSTLNGRGAGVPVFVVALLTTLVAPCLHVLLYPRCAFLASWCAADVVILACVAGLLQLHQFIAFVLGSGMDDVYTAHATLLWPMAPLAAASFFIWFYVARDIWHGGAHAKRINSAVPVSRLL